MEELSLSLKKGFGRWVGSRVMCKWVKASEHELAERLLFSLLIYLLCGVSFTRLWKI